MSSPSLRIEKLERIHAVEKFDCGKAPLNRFLIRYALQNLQSDASQTYVALSGGELIGYYTLVVGQVEMSMLGTTDHGARTASHGIPCRSCCWHASQSRRPGKGRGVGSGLLNDAMLRTLQAAEIAGIRDFAVHATDDQARAFYERVRPAPLTRRSVSSVHPAQGCPHCPAAEPITTASIAEPIQAYHACAEMQGMSR